MRCGSSNSGRRSPSSAPVPTSYSVAHNVTKLPKLSTKVLSAEF